MHPWSMDELGWTPQRAESFAPFAAKGLVPARVLCLHRNGYDIVAPQGVVTAALAGRFRHHTLLREQYPVAGDWVAAAVAGPGDPAVIHHRLDRSGCFTRKLPISGGRKIKDDMIDGGTTEGQTIAANVDTGFIVAAADSELNLSRLDRYITLVRSGGLTPVLILNKVDQCDDVGGCLARARAAAGQMAVHPVSAATGSGMESFAAYLRAGQTVVFVGPSGVGKSTLVNGLLGEERLRTGAVSDATGKGRHTTTGAQLVRHPSGCTLVDTAGMRELQLWCDEEAVAEGFADVLEVVGRCKFKNCQHDGEPGCAVRQALKDGRLSRERYESFRKQTRELSRLQQKRKEFGVLMNQRAKRALLERCGADE